MNKIILYLVTPLMILSLSLYLVGVRQVSFDNSFYNLFKNLSNTTANIKIPNIGKLGMGASADERSILFLLIRFVNFLVNIVNLLITLLNIVLQLLMTIFNFIRAIILWRSSLPKGVNLSVAFA